MEVNLEKRTCYVKIVVNPQATKSFALRFEMYPKKDVNLKIMLPNPHELGSILDEIKKQIPIKYNFNVQWNWKNVPQAIKEDKKFQEEILKIFSSGISVGNTLGLDSGKTINPGVLPTNSNTEYSKLAAIIKMHVEHYGAAPDFRSNHTEKNKLKIHNYIKAALGMPKLTLDETNIIVDIINKDLVA